MNKDRIPSIVAMVAVAFVAGWLLGSGRLDSGEQIATKPPVTTVAKPKATTTSSTSTTQPWRPSGYNVYSYQDGIAFRWLESNEFKCEFYDWCWGMEILTRYGCPSSLYAEINILNKGGANIGWTNDTAQRLRSGDKAILVFGTYENDAKMAEIAEITCY